MLIEIKYSLIIPHYNDIRLKRLLDSLPARDDIQVLVIDDCSPDQISLERIKFSLPNVCFLSTPINMGAGAARNVGLEHAVGNFVLFADADDEFLPGAFDVFDRSVNPDVDITYFLASAWQEQADKPSVRADDLNELCYSYYNEPNEKNLLELRLKHCVPWAKVYKKDFLCKNNIMFDETFVSNDVYFNTINAVLAKNVAACAVSVYKVYRLTDSLTSTTTSDRLIQRVKVSARTEKKLKELGFKGGRSASGYILESVNYGLTTFLKVVWISINSDLKLNLLHIIQPKKWLDFFYRKKVINDEKSGRN